LRDAILMPDHDFHKSHLIRPDPGSLLATLRSAALMNLNADASRKELTTSRKRFHAEGDCVIL